MLSFIVIFLAIIVEITTCSPVSVDLLYEYFNPSDETILPAPDEYSILTSKPSEPTFELSQPLSSDDISLFTSNDQASFDDFEQGLDPASFNFALETPSCNLGKRDEAACSQKPEPQGPLLQLPDLLQVESSLRRTNPRLAPITIELGDKSPSKCANPIYSLNLCCNGPLGAISNDVVQFVVYETIEKCRLGE